MSEYPTPDDPEISDDRRFRIQQQGRLLGIAHIVIGVLVGLIGLVFTIYIAMGVGFLVVGTPPAQPNQPALDPVLFGGMFIGLGVVFFVIFEVFAALLVYAGFSFIKRRNHVFLLVIQALNLLNQPLGLILAILSGMYLLKDDVQAIFEEAKAERA